MPQLPPPSSAPSRARKQAVAPAPTRARASFPPSAPSRAREQAAAPIHTVAIVGVGLIGGSFALALRSAGFSGELLGVSSDAAIKAGLESGAISRRATLQEAVRAAQLIYLAQPVDRILETIEALGRLEPSRCLITDAGSTKAVIVQKALECLPAETFLGGHPLAGKEQRGAQAADASLFRNRPYILTPTAPVTPLSKDFREWLSRIGANAIEMSPSQHDSIVAFTSHLPQLLSTALAGTLAKQDKPQLAEVFGSGLLDMTRLAMSAPEIWSAILATNQAEVLAATDAFLDSLRELRESILAGSSEKYFTLAGVFSAKLRKPPSTT